MNRTDIKLSSLDSIRQLSTVTTKTPHGDFSCLEQLSTEPYNLEPSTTQTFGSIASENVDEEEDIGINKVKVCCSNKCIDDISINQTKDLSSFKLQGVSNNTQATQKPHALFTKPKILGINHTTSRARTNPLNSVPFNANISSPEMIIHNWEGKLYKIKRTAFNVCYKEVEAKVEDCKFIYHSKGIRKCFIDFGSVEAKCIHANHIDTFKIVITNCKKPFEFRTTSYDCSKWVANISHQIRMAIKPKNKLTLPIHDPSFFKIERISVMSFLKQASTGDILLLVSNSIGSGVQRMITRSDYDHVAMVLRYSDSRIMLLEATRNKVET
jgi:hypothetical protein